MITKTDDFGYPKEMLIPFLRNAYIFLFQGYQLVLKSKRYSLKKDGKTLENDIRDDIYNEALVLLRTAAKNDRANRSLKFSFYNENRDPSDKNDVKRFDISLNYESAPYVNDIIIECKRLNKNSKNLAYIRNGVHRFVTNRYGYGLPIGGMIGFVEAGNELEIIKDLQDKLSKDESTSSNLKTPPMTSRMYNAILGEHLHQSNHRRNHGFADIELYHLIMDFTTVVSL